MIAKPGFYSSIPEAEYHGDPCQTPSLSASVAKILYNETPGHAWWAHPRLNRSKALEVEQSTKAQINGTVLHRLILGQGRPIKVLSFKDYRTNDAKAARDKALAADEVPILEHDMEVAEEVAAAAKRQIARTDMAEVFADGEAEVTMAWQEDNGIWCRSRLDWLPDSARDGGHVIIPDLKTTGQSAHPAEWQRTMFDFGGDIQAAFYERGLRKLVPGIRSVDFRFVVIEQTPPYALSLCRVGSEALEQARDAVDLTIRSWGELLKRGTELEQWPFYDTETVSIDPPIWRSQGSELLRMRMLNRMAEWQRPHNRDVTKAA
jgi:hypothetical protein